MRSDTPDRLFAFVLCSALVLAPTAPLLAAAPPCAADLSGPGGDPDGIVSSEDLAVLLADWGPCDRCAGDIDSDGVVGSKDLAEILTAWGPCPGSVIEVDFEGLPVVVDLPYPQFVGLEPSFKGSIEFNLATGDLEGATDVSLKPGISSTITFPGAGPASIVSDLVLVRFPEDVDGPFLVDGLPVPIGTVAEIASTDLGSATDPASWSPLTRSVMAAGVLAASDVWGDVFQSSRVAASNRSRTGGYCEPSWMCRHTATAIGVVIATPIATGCVFLAETCLPAAVASFGWAVVPCVIVTLLCGLAASEIAQIMTDWFLSRCTECLPFSGACCIPYSTPQGCEGTGVTGTFLDQMWICTEMNQELCELARARAQSRGCIYPVLGYGSGKEPEQILFYYPGTPCSQIDCEDWGVCCRGDRIYLTTRDECDQSGGDMFFPVDPADPTTIGSAFQQAFVCFDIPWSRLSDPDSTPPLPAR
jgi:hypothetical protein